MSGKTACSALVLVSKEGTIGSFRCNHGHAISSPCHGINVETIAPVCVQEDRLFDERTGTVKMLYWMGGTQSERPTVGKEG